MTTPNDLARIGALIGEPTRAAILTTLMDGRAFTASELAQCANVTPQTASSHLAMLADADLIRVQKQGRRRYHRLSSAQVAAMIESVMEIAVQTGAAPKPICTGPKNEDMRRARTCYDHFAGRLGVRIAEALIDKGFVELNDEGGLITDRGVAFFETNDIWLSAMDKKTRRPLCRPCLDWSERKPHIGGRLGAAIYTHFIDKGYVRPVSKSRAVMVTRAGERALRTLFGITHI